MLINMAPGWRRDAAPRGVRCLVTARSPGGLFRVYVATLSEDFVDDRWFSDGNRIFNIIAWMPAPPPAHPVAALDDILA